MAAFLSGEMKDTVQLNPAGAYGSFVPELTEHELTVDRYSFGTFLLEEGTPETVPQLGWKRKHVDQGISHRPPKRCTRFTTFSRVVKQFGEPPPQHQTTIRTPSTPMENSLRSDPVLTTGLYRT